MKKSWISAFCFVQDTQQCAGMIRKQQLASARCLSLQMSTSLTFIALHLTERSSDFRA